MSDIRYQRDENGQFVPSTTTMIKGAVGVAKAALGVGAASADAVQARWQVCMTCEHHDAGRCNQCGCFTGAKVRVAGERCPIGKWIAVTIATADASARRGCCGHK